MRCGGDTRAATRPTARRRHAPRRVDQVSEGCARASVRRVRRGGGRCPTDRPRVSFGFFSKESLLPCAPPASRPGPPGDAHGAPAWSRWTFSAIGVRDEEADDAARPGMTRDAGGRRRPRAKAERIALKTPGPDRSRPPRRPPAPRDSRRLPTTRLRFPDGFLTRRLAKAAASPPPHLPEPAPRARLPGSSPQARRAIQARERHSRRLPRGESAPERRGERPRAAGGAPARQEVDLRARTLLSTSTGRMLLEPARRPVSTRRVPRAL